MTFLQIKPGDTLRPNDQWMKRVSVLVYWYKIPDVMVGQKVSPSKAKFYRRPVPKISTLHGVYQLKACLSGETVHFELIS
jgi:hypothetical protein